MRNGARTLVSTRRRAATSCWGTHMTTTSGLVAPLPGQGAHIPGAPSATYIVAAGLMASPAAHGPHTLPAGQAGQVKVPGGSGGITWPGQSGHQPTALGSACRSAGREPAAACCAARCGADAR